MNNRGNLNLGDEIKNIVQNALNNKDFNKLNRDIGNIAKSALDEVRRSINEKLENQNNWKNQNWDGNTHKDDHNTINNSNKVQSQANNKGKLSLKPTKFTVPIGQVSSIMFTVFGSIGSIGFGIAIFVLTLLGFTIGDLFHTIAIGLMPFFILSVILFMKGNEIRKRLKRFQKYVLYMGVRSYCLISDLSSVTGLSNKFTGKDLRKMIASGMFPEGHIDDKKTWFILNNECYSQYLELQKNIEIKNLEKLEKQKHKETGKTFDPEKERNKNDGLTPEIRKSIDEGRKVVLEIKTANIAIPGQEISRKLDRLEEVTGKIFDYVEIHPGKFTEIRKFTEYFLPTTLKLLEAYRKLDYQTVQGENISSAKAEIEQTMDTINLAFENLLDDLFQDMAMDISTDISVLETMFVQEGLTKKNIRVENKTMEEKE